MVNRTIEIQGLQPLPKDKRDFALGNVFKLPRIEEIPDRYMVGFPSVVDQGNSDFCAAAASCALSEIQEGMPLSYEWVFAVAKMVSGNVEQFGTDLRTICEVHVKYGAIERSEAPFSIPGQTPQFLRYIENWPSTLFEKAKKHKKGSYFAVTGPYDNYDNIRATMWYFRDEKCGVLFGVMWGWIMYDVFLKDVPQKGFGHAMAQIGWDERGMFVQNSAGEAAGDGGRHYVSREVINHFVDIFGAFILHDMPKEDAQWYHENEIYHTDNWIVQAFKTFRSLVKSFFNKIII